MQMRKDNLASIDYEVSAKPNGTTHQFKRNCTVVKVNIDNNYTMEISPYENGTKQEHSRVSIKDNDNEIFNGSINELTSKLK